MQPDITDKPSAARIVLPPEFAPVLPTGAALIAVETLGHQIVAGKYAPGETMPNEADLASMLGVSRATVRDAIKVLTGKGLVRTARRYGTRVRAVRDWNLLDGCVVSWHASDHPRMAQIFAETTELRGIVEPEAAALAAKRASGEQIRTIMEAAKEISPGEADMQSLFDADCRFHVTILEATQNDIIAQMRQVIVVMLRVSFEIGIVSPDNRILSRESHIAVAKAIANGDASAARREMDDMLARNRSVVQRLESNAETGVQFG